MKKLVSLLLALSLIIVAPLMASAVDSIEAPVTPPDIEDIIEDHQTTYEVIIHYVYPDGTPAAPDETDHVDTDQTITVPSPDIPSHTPTQYFITISHPTRDMEFTVIYVPGYYNIEDYDTPLGIGTTIMNLGVCIE